MISCAVKSEILVMTNALLVVGHAVSALLSLGNDLILNQKDGQSRI